MTKEEIKQKLTEMRASAFYDLRTLARASPSLLTSAGYAGKTRAEAVLEQFLLHDKKIELTLMKWERENPE